MSRIAIPATPPAESQPMLDAVHGQLGVTPNLFRLAAISPAVLGGMTSLSAALAKALDVRTRERIAIATAEVSGCDYCLSAHTYLALNLAKLPQGEVDLNRTGASGDPKADAAVRFAASVARSRGRVASHEVEAVREAGYTDAQIIEIVAVVAENFLTNLINNVAETEIDFPLVRTRLAA